MKNGIIIHEINSQELLKAVREIVREELNNAVREEPVKEKEQAIPEAKQTFNSAEAAEYLRIHRRTLYNRVKENKIEHSKDGKLLFTKKQLDDYLNNYKNK